jgi:D-alanyl-D-alanine carboxypeptidase (penicillin-binding protein 5/6)
MAFEAFVFTRPLPVLLPTAQAAPATAATPISLPWPVIGQAAVGAVGYGVLSTNQATQPVPMASVAKIITALAVLKQKPLALGEQGATITFDSTDVGYYQTYAAEGGSVARVVDGETLSEYQALQTMILPSANNVAESLARWAFGSPEAYYAYANQFVKTLGMNQTTVVDASGFAPATTSTAKDLVLLGEAAMANPVLAQVVGQSQATVPVAGVVKSTNWLLGTDGFVGIKTGNTDQAGGCYLFAVSQNVGGQSATIVGAVMGVPTLADAISSGKSLADAAKIDFADTKIIKAGQVVGSYSLPWGGSVTAVASKDLSVAAWKGTKITPFTALNSVKVPAGSGAQVGSITVVNAQKTASVPVVISQTITKPPIKWRLLRF